MEQTVTIQPTKKKLVFEIDLESIAADLYWTLEPNVKPGYTLVNANAFDDSLLITWSKGDENDYEEIEEEIPWKLTSEGVVVTLPSEVRNILDTEKLYLE